MSLSLENGNYTANVTILGGSGKSTIESPTRLHVENGEIQAEIIWNSPNYDYMKIGDKEYYSVIESGKSVFLIDVDEFDCDIPFIAQTVAMSEPHLIEYTMSFDSQSIKSEESSFSISVPIIPIVAVAIVLSIVAVFLNVRKGMKSNEDKL